MNTNRSTTSFIFLVLLSSTNACSNGESSDPLGSTQSQATFVPTWKMVTLIVHRTEVGTAANERRTMLAETIAEVRATAKQIPNSFASWSGQKARATMDIIDVDDLAIESVEDDGWNQGNKWAGPTSTAAILQRYVGGPKFDSIFVVWQPPTAVQTCCYYGIGPRNDTFGATYAALHPSWDQETAVHEWLHGGHGYFDGRGVQVADPHDNAQYCQDADCNVSFREPLHDSWAPWYSALLSGEIYRAGDPSRKKLGYTANVWALGTPTAPRTAEQANESQQPNPPGSGTGTEQEPATTTTPKPECSCDGEDVYRKPATSHTCGEELVSSNGFIYSCTPSGFQPTGQPGVCHCAGYNRQGEATFSQQCGAPVCGLDGHIWICGPDNYHKYTGPNSTCQ